MNTPSITYSMVSRGCQASVVACTGTARTKRASASVVPHVNKAGSVLVGGPLREQGPIQVGVKTCGASSDCGLSGKLGEREICKTGMRDCEHKDFDAHVAVIRLEDSGDRQRLRRKPFSHTNYFE